MNYDRRVTKIADWIKELEVHVRNYNFSTVRVTAFQRLIALVRFLLEITEAQSATGTTAELTLGQRAIWTTINFCKHSQRNVPYSPIRLMVPRWDQPKVEPKAY